MLFKRIEIYNFGRYQGQNVFDATITKDRNVILIKALNDRGKTTLFKAIQFALYGEDQNIKASQWINSQSAAEGDGKMYVGIKFEHKDVEYYLRRSIEFRQTDIGKEINTVGNPKLDFFDENGPINTKYSEANQKDWISAILPKDASQFFFFDGEEINRYIRSEEVHVQLAIERVLGIKELLNARDDLNEIHARFESEYQRNAKKHTRDGNELEQLQKGINEYKQGIDEETAIKNGAESEKNKLKGELARHTSINSVVKERSKAEQNREKLEETIRHDEKKLAESRGNLGLILLSGLLHIVDKTKESYPAIEQWESQTVQEILDRKLETCVCGRPIDEKIRKSLDSKKLESKPSRESDLKMLVGNILKNLNLDQKWFELKNALESVAVSIAERDEVKSTITRCTREIGEVDVSSINALEEKYEEVIKDIAKCEDNLKHLKQAKKEKENRKKVIESRISSSINDSQLKAAERRKNICKTVVECMDEAVQQFYEKRKPELEEYISRIFSRLTNNPELYRGIKIDKNFNIKVVRSDGTSLSTRMYSPSPGAAQVVATAMIGGLNEFAIKNAPIVIDTPMARLDPEHRKNIIGYYSKMGKQIIILYQPTELNDTEIESINDHLASEWEIDSIRGYPARSKISKKVSHI